ncbi:MAG: nuclear transport factor 2 family protein [Dehalococcoidia bacterium]
MGEAEARQVVERYIHYLHNRDEEGLASLFATGSVLTNPLGSYQGREAVRQFYGDLFSSYRSYHLGQLRFSVGGDEVSLQWYAEGQPSFQEGPVGMPGCSYFLIRGGQIQQLKVYYDAAQLQRQLAAVT